MKLCVLYLVHCFKTVCIFKFYLIHSLYVFLIQNTMKKFTVLILTISIFSSNLFAQTPIDLAEKTLKIAGLGGEEVFYYGFAEGDQLIFNFEEVNGKELKEIEIIELPSSSKFMDFKAKKIENKVLNISRTGIYKFRFSNAAISGRICKVKIQRVPGSALTQNFSTSVYWKTILDTTYSIEQERYLIRADTSIVNITDQIAKVHSTTNPNGYKTTFNFTLPNNTVSWSYYIGVDQAGQQAYESAAKLLATKAAPLVSKFPGYGPIAALALGGVSYLSTIQSGEDIDFYFVEGENVNLFLSGQSFNYLKKGKVINDYSRMTRLTNGNLHLCLSNDNAVTGVSVSVKITAIVVNERWGQRPVKRMHVASKEVPYLKN